MDPWLEIQVDAFARMQLLDLARALTRSKDAEVKFEYFSGYVVQSHIVSISQFWDDYPAEEQMVGRKSDVYLRCIGSAWFSDSTVIADFLKEARHRELPRFCKQLFSLCEDVRLESIVTRLRPGTSRIFTERRKMYTSYFEKKIPVHLRSVELADALFAAIYLCLVSSKPDVEGYELPEKLIHLLAQIQPFIQQVWEAREPKEIADASRGMMDIIQTVVKKDIFADYFSTHEENGTAHPLSYESIDDLKRHKKLKNNDTDTPEQEDSLRAKDKLPSWHRESSEQGQSFLQFDLEQGTKTKMLGDSPREADPGDQALAVVRGSAQQSKKNDFTPLDEAEVQMPTLSGMGKGGMGEANRGAKTVFVPVRRPEAGEVASYRELAEQIEPHRKKLQRTLQMTIEQKKLAARPDLPFGRLSRKLIRFVTEDDHRLFYKKRNPVHHLDAAFLLMIDCSASMIDKMEQTKAAAALFHETLRSLSVPHAVAGFWEDANKATDTIFPNCFQVVIPFAASLFKENSSKIMQLAPEQDNRDGYAIRVMTRYLMERVEKQRFLLVFSDGEPAAAAYHEQGIVDTYQAVLEARQKGIEVIGIFLGDGEIKDRDRQTMQNIYGHSSIIVPHVNELAQHLAPILRKLLLKLV
jgi:nitric oxide reductase activation protein